MLSRGLSPGTFERMLQRKYDIMQQSADAEALRSEASMLGAQGSSAANFATAGETRTRTGQLAESLPVAQLLRGLYGDVAGLRQTPTQADITAGLGGEQEPQPETAVRRPGGMGQLGPEQEPQPETAVRRPGGMGRQRMTLTSYGDLGSLFRPFGQ